MINATIAVIIPTFNMLESLKILVQSIINSGLVELCNEIILVDDASTDGTKSWISSNTSSPQFHKKLIFINSPNNEGRYLARLKGAQAAKSSHLLFLDTRTEFENDSVKSLASLMKKFEIIQGTIKIPRDESIYNLYWERSHKFLFTQNFTDQVNGFWLTPKNYEDYTSGTGIFYCNKQIFIEASNIFKTAPLSDDRALIKEICQLQKIWVTQELQVIWRPRQEFKSFLFRLWERGPSFVSYHFYGSKSKMKLPVYIGLTLIAANIILMIIDSKIWILTAIAQFAAVGMSIVVFTRSPKEIMKLFWLHIAVVLTFGSAILWGLWTERRID